MTTVPSVDCHTVNLLCDGCGQIRRVADTLRDPDLVWPLLVASGWSGSPFAMGRHWCPNCTSTPIPATEDRQVDGKDDQRRPCQLGVEPLRTATLVTVGGDLRGADVSQVQEVFTAAVAAGRPVLVDLSEAVLDSASLGILVRAYGDLRLRGSTLCCVAPSTFVRIVLHTMRLDRAIPTFDDQDSALAWLSSLSRTPAPVHCSDGVSDDSAGRTR